jgi:hypothetical protein
MRWLGCIVAILLCGLHAYAARHTMNPDGVSYLDLADGILRGDSNASFNPYWSPLYPWLLARTLAAFRPAAYWECAVVHGLNFAIFLAALAAFECFLSEWLLSLRRPQGRTLPLSDRWLTGIAYACFIWMARRLVTVSIVTPDMCVAAFVLLVAALALRNLRLGPRPARSAALGVVLAGGYLAKAILLPLGFVFLGASAIGLGSFRRALIHLALATSALLVIAGAYVAALSIHCGYFTFGDSGKLNYAWYVGGVPRPHATDADGLTHPPRRLGGSLAVYEFAGPAGVTYPLWYDPAFWNQGLATRISASRQAAALARTAASYFGLLGEQLVGFTGAITVLVLFALFAKGGSIWLASVAFLRNLGRQCAILLPVVSAVGLYALVGHVEGRLIGPFLVLLAAALLAAVRVAADHRQAADHLARACVWGLAGLLGINVLFDAGNAVASFARGEGPAAHSEWSVACYLHSQGLREGDSIGFVGFTFDAYWARLARLRIVAEVPEGQAPRFWSAGDSVRNAALDSFASAGARAVVARVAGGAPPDWLTVPSTNFVFQPIGSTTGTVLAKEQREKPDPWRNRP